MTRAPVTPSDLARLASISDVQIAASGAEFAAVVSVPDLVTNVNRRTVVAGVFGESSGEVTTADGSEYLPRWSPVGAGLATVLRDANGCHVLLRRELSGKAEVVVRDWPDDIEELCWSPDGRLLLFVAREPTDRDWWALPDDRKPPLRLTRLRYREDAIGWTFNRPRQAWLVAADGGDPWKLSVGGHDDGDFTWYPDGRSVLFVSQRHASSDRSLVNDVFRQDLGSTEPVRLTRTAHCYAQPRVSPDGDKIAVRVTDVLNNPVTTDLAMLRFDGRAPTLLSAELDRDCNRPQTLTPHPIWVDDQTLVGLVEDRGTIQPYQFDVSGAGKYRRIPTESRCVQALDVSGDTMVFVSSGPTEPPRLVVRSADGQESTLVDPNEGERRARDLREPVQRSVQAAEGVAVDSWLTLPDPDRWQAPYPLLVCMQGGGTQYGHQWSHDFQTLSSAGYATLYLNPRGCAGYGTDWMRAVSGPRAAVPGEGWGVNDINDVVAVVDATLQANGELDAQRVGVLGGSYGALVTTWLLATTDRFAAGWAERGPYNLFSDAGTMDDAPWFFGTYLGCNHLDEPEAYWEPSPLRVVKGITDPLMIVHSEEDRRCPIQQAEELFMALKLLDREVEFVRFPGECHELSRSGSPVHRVQRLDLMLEWFGKWLNPVERLDARAK